MHTTNKQIEIQKFHSRSEFLLWHTGPNKASSSTVRLRGPSQFCEYHRDQWSREIRTLTVTSKKRIPP